MKLYPRCHPNINDSLLSRGLAYTGTGHLLPCCWCDYNGNEDIVKTGLLDEEMKLENFNSVKDVLLTKQWVNFHKILLLHPEKAPSVCRKKCSLESIQTEIAEDE